MSCWLILVTRPLKFWWPGPADSACKAEVSGVAILQSSIQRSLSIVRTFPTLKARFLTSNLVIIDMRCTYDLSYSQMTIINIMETKNIRNYNLKKTDIIPKSLFSEYGKQIIELVYIIFKNVNKENYKCKYAGKFIIFLYKLYIALIT